MALEGSRPAVFLDKDGTLVEDLPYNADPERMQLLPGVAEGVRRLVCAGFVLIVVSNQSGVARGYFLETALQGVEARLRGLLEAAGGRLDAFYYCPHHPGGSVTPYNVECDCRKPAPGMLLRATRELQVDLSRSWLIGDILNDVEAGRRAGCRTILIDNGNETEWLDGPDRTPHHVASDLAQAAELIVQAMQDDIAPAPLVTGEDG